MSDTLAIVPTYLREPRDLEMTLQTLSSLRKTEPDLDLVVVDDHSPVVELTDALCTHQEQYRFEMQQTPRNGGFSRAVNVGLRMALATDRDAILVNADMQFMHPWAQAMRDTLDDQGTPAAVVGALLLYGNGLIQHAGIFVSVLTRSWMHWYAYAPGQLPQAHRRRVCPVTGALQYIRNETLQQVGIYPEGKFRMGYEDVCYCLDVFESGRECVYQPGAVAIHHESMFRGRADDKLIKWQQESWLALQAKHGATNVNRWLFPIA